MAVAVFCLNRSKSRRKRYRNSTTAHQSCRTDFDSRNEDPAPKIWQPACQPSTRRMSVGLAQVDAVLGDPNANVAKARELLSQKYPNSRP